MKKKLLVFTLVLFTIIACSKKAEVIPHNTISATVDGVNMSFNVNVSAHLKANAGGPGTNTMLSISGLTSAKAPRGSMTIIFSTESLNKGTYTYAFESVNNSPPVFIQLIYGYYDPASNAPVQPYATDFKSIQPTTITITSISNTNVQGTFSGTLVYPQGGTVTKTVANGKFDVNISD